jgi:hypothetical protein
MVTAPKTHSEPRALKQVVFESEYPQQTGSQFDPVIAGAVLTMMGFQSHSSQDQRAACSPICLARAMNRLGAFPM